MIIVDTNVLSELMRADAEQRVLRWLSAQPVLSLHTTAITEAEILAGLGALPRGKRRTSLEDAALALFTDFRGRILSFDSAAAREYAEVARLRRRAGRPIAFADAQIAAIARATGARVATRDVGGFEDCDVDVVDPWTAGAR